MPFDKKMPRRALKRTKAAIAARRRYRAKKGTKSGKRRQKRGAGLFPSVMTKGVPSFGEFWLDFLRQQLGKPGG